MLYEHHAVSFTLGHCFFQDKILQSFSKNEEIQVTNDGATILKSIGVDNPAAKILVGKKKKTVTLTYKHNRQWRRFIWEEKILVALK